MRFQHPIHIKFCAILYECQQPTTNRKHVYDDMCNKSGQNACTLYRMAVSTFLVGFLLLLFASLSSERDQVGVRKFENGREDHVKKEKPCSHADDSKETDYIYEYEINGMCV